LDDFWCTQWTFARRRNNSHIASAILVIGQLIRRTGESGIPGNAGAIGRMPVAIFR
jgi:hypothetical protein